MSQSKESNLSTVFPCCGLGGVWDNYLTVLDISSASLVYRKAVELEAGQEFGFSA
ncbi:MAG: hypothetical protein HQ478_05995 [Chloroflexi bacterium]|nr:hypothetical protein [Chloroflexota bacterium]